MASITYAKYGENVAYLSREITHILDNFVPFFFPRSTRRINITTERVVHA